MAFVTLNTGDEISLGAGTHTIDGTGKVTFTSTSAQATYAGAGGAADTVAVVGASTDYNASKDGTNLVLTHKTTGKTITIASGTTADTVTFSNGSLTLQYVTDTGIKLGTQVVSNTTPAAISDTPTGAGTSTGTGTTAGQTFSLTENVETKTLTSANDTVDGSTVADSINGDTIVDGSTTDSDVLSVKLTSGTSTPTAVVNLETINVDFKGFGITLGAAGISSDSASVGTNLKVTTSQAGNDTATITGIANKNVNVTVDSTIKTLSLAGSTGTSDATTVKLAGGNLAATLGDTNAIETVTLNSSTAASTVTLGTGSFAGAGATGHTLKIAGDQDIAIKSATANVKNVQIFEEAAYTKTSTLELTDSASGASLANANVDKIVLSAVQAGTVSFRHNANLSLNVANTLSGATLTLAQPVSTIGTTGTGTMTTLNISVDKATGMGTGIVTFGDPVSVINLVANQTIGTPSGSLPTLTLSDGTTGDDTVTLNVSGTKDVFLNVTSDGSGTTGGAADKMVINAGSLTTGKLYLTASGGVTNGIEQIVAIGSAQADTVTVAGGPSTVLGGSGNDTITGGTGADKLLGEAGDDVLVLSNGTDTLEGGAGADTFVAASGSTGTINDFVVGTDIISLTGAGKILDVTKVLLSSGVLQEAASTSATGFTAITLKNNEAVLTNTSTGGDDWSTSMQLGSGTGTGSDYEIAAGSGAVKAGSLADNIQLAAGTGRTIDLGNGNDTLRLVTGVSGSATGTGEAGVTVTITGGAGNDTIDVTATSSVGTAIIKFGATAAANGQDIISGFDVDATGTGGSLDKLDFTAFLGTNATLATSAVNLGASSGVGGTGNDVFVAYKSATTELSTGMIAGAIGTSGTLVVQDGTKAVVILAGAGGTGDALGKIYYVENGAAAGTGDVTIELVGTISFAVGTISTIKDWNIVNA